MIETHYIKGQAAWDMLIALNWDKSPTYSEFFKAYDVFYKPWYTSDEPVQCKFDWIIQRDWKPSHVSDIEPPYYEVCLNRPAGTHSRDPLYKPPVFIWKCKRGVDQIWIAPKIDFQI